MQYPDQEGKVVYASKEGRTGKLDEVMQVLEKVHVNLMTLTNALGRGRQKGVTEICGAA